LTGIYPYVSIIVPCREEGHYVGQTIRQMMNTPAGIPYEIIVVDDGSRDGCCDFLRRELNAPGTKAGGPAVNLLTTSGVGAARARNLGAAAARAAFLVFCDAHVIVSPGWLEGLLGCLEKREADAVCPAIELTRPPGYTFYGGAWNKNLSWTGIQKPPPGLQAVPLLPSGCLGVRADVFRGAGGFEKGFRIWGYEDAEFSLKLWLFGYRAAVWPSVRVLHVSRTLHSYQSGEHLVHNLLLLAVLHFSGERLARAVSLARRYPGFTPGLEQKLREKYSGRRQAYFRRRVFSDDWFMQKFGIPF